MECPKCKYIMVEDLDVGLATCSKCNHVIEMGGPELPKESGTIGVGRILGAAAKVYRMEMHRFLGIWAVPAFLVFLLNFLFWLAFYTLPADTQIREDMVPMLISMIFASSLFSAMISIFFAAPVIRMATDVFFHNKTTVSSGLSIFNKKLAILLAFSIVFSIPFALPDLFGGSLLCYIPAMMCCYWWMFALVILVIEGSELREAFSLGKEFATRSGSFSFAMLVMLSIATMEISFQYVSIYAAQFFPLPQTLVIYMAAAAIAKWLIYPFLIIAITSYYLARRGALKAFSSPDEEDDEEDEEGDDTEEDDGDNEVGEDGNEGDGGDNGSEEAPDAKAKPPVIPFQNQKPISEMDASIEPADPEENEDWVEI